MEYRTIAYVSEVQGHSGGSRVPKSLFEIYQGARRKNAQKGITGVLSYADGHFLQVIEGDEKAVDQLYISICSDPRHKNVTTILDKTSNQRYFPKSSMRLIASAARDKSLRDFFRANRNNIVALENDERERLNIFYKVKTSTSGAAQNSAAQEAQTESFQGKRLKLLGWPDFTQVKQTPSVIGLCAHLTAKAENYGRLVSGGEFGNQQQVDDILRQFQYLGILVVSEASTTEPQLNSAPDSSDSFYKKMKNFLKFG